VTQLVEKLPTLS